MSLELGIWLFAIILIGMVVQTVIDCRSSNALIKRIQDVEKDNANLKKQIETLDEWRGDFKKELIQRRRDIDWLKAQMAKLQAEKAEAQIDEQETPEESEGEND